MNRPELQPLTMLLTLLTMLAFAANSLLCRLALGRSGIDPASFTTLRLAAGALVLWLLLARRQRPAAEAGGGSWPAALALFAYAASFSFAYLELQAGTGALLLFCAVQATMIGAALLRGEHLIGRQWAGVIAALGGLLLLLAPGLTAPPLRGALLMVVSGCAWGAYSLLGRSSHDPLPAVAGHFLRTLPFTLLLSGATLSQSHLGLFGSGCALLSGGLASAGGYVLWHAVLKRLRVTSAAIVQLSVPVLTALLAIPLLAEHLTLRLALASLAILGGIALVVLAPAASVADNRSNSG